MISLEQILLLEKKVESAVSKIQQLQAENDALRTKCSELSNALSSKSEQLSSFEQDQSKIESGIMNALERLSSIENSVLKTAESSKNENILNNSINPINYSSSEHNQISQVESSESNSRNENPSDNFAGNQNTQTGNEFVQEASTEFSLQTPEDETQTDYEDDSDTDENGQFDIF